MSKILVVDDSSTVRDEVAGFLKKNGLAVDTAVDGKDGLAKIKANPGLRLVISDVNMPNMDGLTMVEKVRGELGNKTVNVIMLTTESSPAMKDRGKAAGRRLDHSGNAAGQWRALRRGLVQGPQTVSGPCGLSVVRTIAERGLGGRCVAGEGRRHGVRAVPKRTADRVARSRAEESGGHRFRRLVTNGAV